LKTSVIFGPYYNQCNISRAAEVIVALSFISLVAGINLSCAASRFSRHAIVLEQSGGVLFMAGLVLLGACLPRMC